MQGKVLLTAMLEFVFTFQRIHFIVVIPQMKPVQRIPGKFGDMRYQRSREGAIC